MIPHHTFRFVGNALIAESAQNIERIQAKVIEEDSIVYEAQRAAHTRIYQVRENQYVVALGKQIGEAPISWIVALGCELDLLTARQIAANYLSPYLAQIREKTQTRALSAQEVARIKATYR
jgi:hypothetical protein